MPWQLSSHAMTDAGACATWISNRVAAQQHYWHRNGARNGQLLFPITTGFVTVAVAFRRSTVILLFTDNKLSVHSNNIHSEKPPWHLTNYKDAERAPRPQADPRGIDTPGIRSQAVRAPPLRALDFTVRRTMPPCPSRALDLTVRRATSLCATSSCTSSWLHAGACSGLRYHAALQRTSSTTRALRCR